MTTRTPAGALAGALMLIGLAGCSSSDDGSGGPGQVADGSYVFLASSAGGTPAATLEIAGQELTLVEGATTTSATVGAAVPEAVLCPPSGKGQPQSIDTPLTVGGISLSTPAIFGDCGQVTPVRVTLIDLDSYDEAGGPFGYTRWVEFCNTTDPDCASPTS